jgi:CAAX prenyl protease-like protein
MPIPYYSRMSSRLRPEKKEETRGIVRRAEPSSIEYWIPMVAFAVLTVGESYLSPEWFPAAYIIKAIVVTACLLIWRAPLGDIRFDLRVVPPSIVIGLVVFVLWIAVDKLVPYPHLGLRTAFDPTSLQGSGWWPAFLGVRLYGLVLMVPVMEEIFWRSFLVRFLTQPDFRKLPVGTFSASALWIMVAASALSHPEWLVAVIASLAYGLWIRRTRSLFGAIVAHATTNGALGAYVLATGEWQYW